MHLQKTRIRIKWIYVSAVSDEVNEDPKTTKTRSNSEETCKIHWFYFAAYRTEDGQPYVLPVVKKTEAKLIAIPQMNHEYTLTCGEPSFTKACGELLLGNDSPAIREGRVQGIQTISGTGSLFLGAQFLCQELNSKTVYLSDPSWGNFHISFFGQVQKKTPNQNTHWDWFIKTKLNFCTENHARIFARAGFKDIRSYRYYDPETCSVDIDGMLSDLENADDGAVILLHACAHNPTGCDPTQSQWVSIANTIEVTNSNFVKLSLL